VNEQDLAMLRTVTRRTADVIGAIRRLASFEPGVSDANGIIAEIADLEQVIEGFVDDLAAREAASWGREAHRPRFDAPQRIAAAKMPLSTEVEPHTIVERYGMNGRLKSAAREDPPQGSGRWTMWRTREHR
jgi:hypothetical protein